MSLDVNAMRSGIFDKLTGASALTTLLSAGTAGVFAYLAPENEDPPYVVFSPQSPPLPQRRLGGGSVAWEDALWLVKAVAEGHSAAEAGTSSKQIDVALDLATLTVSGYTTMSCAREQAVSYPEFEAGKRFNHEGALYRVRLLV